MISVVRPLDGIHLENGEQTKKKKKMYTSCTAFSSGAPHLRKTY